MKTNEHDLRLGSAVDAYAHLLGKVSDGEIAKMAGVTIVTVCAYRNRRGIAPAIRTYKNNIAASNGGKCLLCTTPPRIRGLCFRCYMRCRSNGTLETVALPSAKRGRKPMIVAVPVVVEPPAPVFGSEYKPVPKSKCAYRHLLGKVSDTLIAEVYGADQGNVSRVRRRLKIPAMEQSEATWVTRGFKNYLASLGNE